MARLRTHAKRSASAGSFFFSSFAGSEKRTLEADPSVFRRRLDYQFTRLLVTPFNNTKHQFDSSILPKVFFIDGLDEVEAVRLANEEDQEEILSALLNATSDPTFPFRIVVASRLERVIQTFFSSDAAHVTREIFLDDKYDPDADIASLPTRELCQNPQEVPATSFLAVLNAILDWRTKASSPDPALAFDGLESTKLFTREPDVAYMDTGYRRPDITISVSSQVVSRDFLHNKGQSAATRIPESHRTHFLCHFIQECPGPTLPTPATNLLDGCDVIWWVQFAVHELSDQESQACIFEMVSIHSCVQYSPPNPHSARVGLRENATLDASTGEATSFELVKDWAGAFPMSLPCFGKQCISGSGTPGPWFPSSVFLGGWLYPGNGPTGVERSGPPSGDLVRDMFSHLPTYWELQFTQEVKEDRDAPWSGFTTVIQKIMQDVGIEVPDVAPSDYYGYGAYNGHLFKLDLVYIQLGSLRGDTIGFRHDLGTRHLKLDGRDGKERRGNERGISDMDTVFSCQKAPQKPAGKWEVAS
ncbi:hypothetical protein FA13DRAFT_1716002 [Coprinellus micaceus]|uniref:NACHT domain-containing protein n=1 Tax=Coprinellus micaceus TaxID=71717 RepID=A0A4Y7SL64_COPMI|nr:hypothetical protein FA13DRAFT_1716002 [Coprinellus micaceus]